MTNILSKRDYYQPLTYPWAFEMYRKQLKLHWIPDEVPMQNDLTDWKHNLNPAEKNLLMQIFRFFTTADVDVAKGYAKYYLPVFNGHPEVTQMLTTFASYEAIHVEAYALLLNTLGIAEGEFKAFTEYKEMLEKHEYMSDMKMDTLEDKLRTIAVYSGFGEGLQLFSSFAILMNFPRYGKMKGMGQIVTWSIRDESIHCEGMLKLFRTLVEENPHVWTDELKGTIYEACRRMVDLEDKFIDLAFAEGGVEGLDKNEVKEYIRYIADRRLNQMGLKANYNIKENPLPWLEEMLNAQEHANFFETRVTEYQKGALQGDWNEVWS